MNDDYVLAGRTLRREKAYKTDWTLWLVAAILFVGSLLIYRWEDRFTFTDMHVHTMIARDFDFTDLHSITSRLAYPLWHLCTSALYQLGMPVEWASATVCALCKTAALFLARGYALVALGDGAKPRTATLAALCTTLVTGLCLPWFNPRVYQGIGSPNAWHNPTQLAVNVSMLLCVPYVVHCWYDFERRLPGEGERTALPWRKVVTLAVLLMASLACKPTFMQALLPAAFVFFAIEWARRPKNWRYFLQIILAFLPAAAYFLLQYLYYTGVVVEFTSGVEFCLSWKTAATTLRNLLLMNAFPLVAMLCVPRDELRKDRALRLTLWMLLFAALEAMSLCETGLREGHGNFTWALNSVSLMLWVLMIGRFLRAARTARAERIGGLRRALLACGWALLVWHVGSGLHYLYFLLSTGNAF